MPSFNFSITLVFLFITICFLLSLTSIEAASSTYYLYNFCNNTFTYTANTPYQANLNDLLSSLSSNAKRDNGFYSYNVGTDPPDIAYGLFLCRGDLSADDCQNCVTTASTEIVRQCTSEKVAIIWYDECMLRYSNQSIHSILAVDPSLAMLNTANVTEPARFDQLLKETVSELVDEQIGGKKYAAKPVDFTQFQKLYAFVQCTPDLSFNDCRTCLTLASFQTLNFSSGKQGGRLLTPSCVVRYEIYPFYSLGWTAAGPSPSATRGMPNATLDLLEISTYLSRCYLH